MFLTTKEFTSEHVLIYAKQQAVKVKFLAFGNSGSNDEKNTKKDLYCSRSGLRFSNCFSFTISLKKIGRKMGVKSNYIFLVCP